MAQFEEAKEHEGGNDLYHGTGFETMENPGFKFSQMAIGNDDSISMNLEQRFLDTKNCLDEDQNAFFMTPIMDHGNPNSFFPNFSNEHQKPFLKKFINNSAPHENAYN
jgi:hypothetical protein